MSSITLDKRRFLDCADSLKFRVRSFRERNTDTEKVSTLVMHLLGMIAISVGVAHAITPILSGQILYGLAYTLVFLAGYGIAYENGKNAGEYEEAKKSLRIFNKLYPQRIKAYPR